MIYTSNYSRKGADPKSISISFSSPHYFKGPQIKALAPPWKIVENYKANKLTEEEYAVLYFEKLLSLEISAQDILDSIPDGSILLCYESPYDFCHRRLFAMWIENETGTKIPEWTDPKLHQQVSFLDNTLVY